jgi:eukaryotic-like serine/threonine-protein kinase
VKAICQKCGTEVEDWQGKCPQCGSESAVKIIDPFIGHVIGGRYKILKRIGSGGMGSVYRAEHTGIGQQVAIKFLSPALSGNGDVVRRFHNEAKSYARVSHPNAVMIHDFGQTDDGQLYISMEFVDGVDLKKVIETHGRLAVDQVIDIGLQLCEVLSKAHETGVFHRDLKPENIMVSQGMRRQHVKVLDFGIARLVGDEQTVATVAGSICGTPRYMSPEQARGRPIDHRTDIYSLGLILFEMATGKHPFPNTSIPEMLRLQVHEPVPHLSEFSPELGLPQRLDEVIQRAISKDPANRFQTVKEMADALAGVVPTLADAQSHDSTPTVPHNPELTTPSLTGSDLDSTVLRPKADSKKIVLAKPESKKLPAITPSPPPVPKKSRGIPTPVLLAIMGGVAFVAVWVAMGRLSPSSRVATAVADQPTPRPPDPVGAPGLPKPQPDVAAKLPDSPKLTNEVPPTPVPTPEPGTTRRKADRTGHARNNPPLPVPGSNERAGGLDDELFDRAKAEWSVGRVSGALNILRDLKGVGQHAAEARELRTQIEHVQGLLTKAKAASKRGQCDDAVKFYQEAISSNDQIEEAKKGMQECKDSLPPATVE